MDGTAAADAYLAWWALAGVDSAVGDSPVNWLRPAPAREASGAAARPAIGIKQRPSDLDSFRAWLADSPDQPESGWNGPRILPAGPVDAPLMIVTDLPEAADMKAGALFSGSIGALLDAIVRAMGIDRACVHTASLALARPPGGVIIDADVALLADRMRAYVALARPRRLLVLGDRTARALLPQESDDDLRRFNHDGGNVPAIAAFHPRLLLQQPAAKAECWRSLQILIEDMPS